MGIFKKQKRIQFAILGVGRFGASLCEELFNAGHDVLAVDISEVRINAIAAKSTQAVIGDVSDDTLLQALGIKNMDTVIICIGANMQASILATLACKDLEVPYIVCKANSYKHKQILEKMGADLIVVPEVDMAKKLAIKMSNPHLDDIMNLNQDFSIIELSLPKSWQNKSLIELDIRKKHEVSVILIKRGEEIITGPGGEYIFEENDVVVLGGDNEKINDFMDLNLEIV